MRTHRETACQTSVWHARADVTELAQEPGRFREIARLKLADSHTQAALDLAT